MWYIIKYIMIILMARYTVCMYVYTHSLSLCVCVCVVRVCVHQLKQRINIEQWLH